MGKFQSRGIQTHLDSSIICLIVIITELPRTTIVESFKKIIFIAQTSDFQFQLVNIFLRGCFKIHSYPSLSLARNNFRKSTFEILGHPNVQLGLRHAALNID